MKKIFSIFVLSLVMVLGFTSCTSVTPDAGQEAVLVHKPWFFGTGGVDNTPVETGLEYTWFRWQKKISTDSVLSIWWILMLFGDIAEIRSDMQKK